VDLKPGTRPTSAADRARFVRDRLPAGGLFADQQWRVALDPLALEPGIAREIESLGRVLLQFYRAVNLLHRRSREGKAPAWVAAVLDQGKPPELLELQSDPAFRNELPRVIRPDLLLTDQGLSATELDSVPGGIGLTSWLYETYEALGPSGNPSDASSPPQPGSGLLGSVSAMTTGFAGIFGQAPTVHLVVSEESASYRPEMEWLASRLGGPRFTVTDPASARPAPGDAVYRFFELFDLANVPEARGWFESARHREIRVTPPPRPMFEEKLLFALLWNRNLRPYWRQELGEAFFNRLLRLVPQTWIVDPTPLPPHAAFPGLDLTDWQQLKSLSQRERDLILKVSGYSEKAWGARGVHLGSDLSSVDWAAAVDEALGAWPRSPYVLQRYHKPRTVEFDWYDFAEQRPNRMNGRVRLCPYYFVHGDADAARPHLGGVLATVCPADKKIIHGMTDAVLAPCSVAVPPASAQETKPAQA
jgi:hypothetical protein